MSNPRTSFRVGDTTYDLYSKWLRRLGGQPRPDDTEESLLRRIVALYGGVSRPADTKFDSLLKIVQALDPNNFCRCGDTEVDLLRDILRLLGGTPRPSDTEFDLLKAILFFSEMNCLLFTDGSEFLLIDREGCLLLMNP